MPNDLADVYRVAMSGYQAAIIQEQGAFQQAQLSGDQNEMVRASQSLAALRSQANEYQAMAREQASSLNSVAPRNKFGLSEREVEVAHASVVDRKDMPSMTDEQKEESYFRAKQRLQRMRATGEYRQTTEQTG
jgi:hypothetical protein